MKKLQQNILGSSIHSDLSQFEKALMQFFPGSRPAGEFIEYSSHILGKKGFQSYNTMVCLSVCRDELCRPFINHIHQNWERVFDFSSLAGMIFLVGITGFEVAHQHAPNADGPERYVYFAFPHIAIDEMGIPGNCRRPGRCEMSHACGALFNLLQDGIYGLDGLKLNQDDLELSLLRQRLFTYLRHTDIPDLVALTKFVHRVIREDLERMIRLTIVNASSPYAVFTGIQIHGPDNEAWIWVNTSYVVTGGIQENLHFFT